MVEPPLPILMMLLKRKLRTFLKPLVLSANGRILTLVEPEHALCPTYMAAMDVLAKPWNGLIIAVLEEGPLRFSELSARVPTIGDRMLASRLKELGERGLVARCVEPGPPVRVSYALTEVGHGFRAVAEAIRRWGQTILSAKEKTVARKPARARRAG
jgi:DNA-binding HxlR family transcriptional regulator